jgi:hypothetical protein
MVVKSERKRPFGRHRRRWEDNIKMDLNEWGERVRNLLIWLRIGTKGAFCEHGNEHSNSIIY